MTIEKRSGNPTYDAFLENQTDRLRELSLSDEFIDLIETRADNVSTTYQNDTPFLPEDDIPGELREVFFFSDNLHIQDLSIELIERREVDLWVLTGRFSSGGLDYIFTMTPKNAVVEAAGYHGDELSLTISPEVCVKMIAAFAVHGDSQFAREMSVKPLKHDISGQTIRDLMRDLLAKGGDLTTKRVMSAEQLADVGRAMLISHTEHEKPKQSAYTLDIQAAVDFGFSESESGTTAIVFSQREIVEDGKNKGMISTIGVGPSFLPIENYLTEIGIFQSVTSPDMVTHRLDPVRYGKSAALLLTTYDLLMQEQL